MTSYTLSNWDGSQDPITKDSVATTWSSDANVVEATPKGQDKRVQGDVLTGESVLSTPMAVSVSFLFVLRCP
jgi:hypothetical protein